MDSQFIAVGRVVAAWGVRGEIKAEVLTDFPDRFSPEQAIYVNREKLTIEKCKWHRGRVILKLSSIDSVESAEELRGLLLQIPQSQLHPLAENEYYQFQLVGLEVWNTKGEHLGQISRILPTGSNDVYVVPSEDGELLIPAIEDVVKSIDLEAGRITIELIEGLSPKRACSK
jgi:16S rRNA processing protein RimM